VGISPQGRGQEIATSPPQKKKGGIKRGPPKTRERGGGGGVDDSGGFPDVLNTKLCCGFFRTWLRSSGSR